MKKNSHPQKRISAEKQRIFDLKETLAKNNLFKKIINTEKAAVRKMLQEKRANDTPVIATVVDSSISREPVIATVVNSFVSREPVMATVVDSSVSREPVVATVVDSSVSREPVMATVVDSFVSREPVVATNPLPVQSMPALDSFSQSQASESLTSTKPRKLKKPTKKYQAARKA
jgi:hypothetical protein